MQTTYEDVLTVARMLLETKEQTQWDLGDLINQSGLPSTQFASDLDTSNRALQSYCQLAKFYPPRVREDYPNLRYTHFRQAHQHSHGYLPTALKYLEHASSEGLKTGQFETWLQENKVSRESVLVAILARVVCFVPPDEHELIGEIQAVLNA